MQHEAVEFRRLEAGSAQVEAHPQQAVTEFHGAAGGIKAVEIIIVAGDNWKNGLQMRIVQYRHLPLRDA